MFSWRKGPVFASLVLADEINRASPKTQSALLEVMEEEQITVDGTTYDVPQPFTRGNAPTLFASGAHGGTPLQLTPNSNLSYGDLSCDLHFLLHYLRQFDGEHSVGHMCCDFLFVDVVRQYQRLLELGV